MAANVMSNFATLTPQQYGQRAMREATMMPLDARAQALANQITQQQVPFVTPMAEQALAQQQFQTEALGLQQPYIQSGLEAQQQLLRDQAGAQAAAAGVDRIRAQYPITLAPTDVAALGFMNQELMGGGQPQPGYGGDYGGMGLNVDVTPESAPAAMAGMGVDFNEPITAPATGEAANLSASLGAQPFEDRQAAVDFLRDNAGMGEPTSVYSGDPIVDNIMAARGWLPERSMEQEIRQQSQARDYIAYEDAISKANSFKRLNAEARLQANAFINSYRQAKGARGALLGAVGPYYSAPAQEAKAASENLAVIASGLIQEGRITDSMLTAVAEGKASIRMKEPVAEHAYEKLMASMDRADQWPEFLIQARANGIPEPDAETMWQKFQEEYPLTGNRQIDFQSLEALDHYLDPLTAANVANGTYIPPRQRTVESFTEQELSAMSPQMLQDLIARSEAMKLDAEMTSELE